MCDNTDCRGKCEHLKLKIYMLNEFEGGDCVWCLDCIKRDSNFIDFNRSCKWEE